MNSNTTELISPDLDSSKIPAHVAIIMDGNGRWAKKRLMNRVKGHEKGSETVRSIVTISRELGVKVLTLYAFSTENWQRPKLEIEALMRFLHKFLVSERQLLIDKEIRLQTIGQIERLPGFVLDELYKTQELSKDNDKMVLNIALSYGARSEIERMVRNISKDAIQGKIDPESISQEMISDYLYTKGLPDPDLLIRTSGEMRISNFLLWQIAYSEIAITKTLWPDFTKEEFIQIIIEYQKRDRRYGKV